MPAKGRLYTSSSVLRSQMTRADDADFTTRFAPKGKNARNTVTRWALFTVGFAGSLGAVYLMVQLSDPRHTDAEESGPLHSRVFQAFEIVAKEEIATTCAVLTLRPVSNRAMSEDPYVSCWEQGLWSVEFKQPQLQIARSYTPLPPTTSMQPTDLRFLIRREHKGEVSNYLSNLPVGNSIGIRGPEVELRIPQATNRVVFLAGGTGIAPALQTIHTLLKIRGRAEDESVQPTQIHVLWANRRSEDCAGAVSEQKSWLSFLGSSSKSSSDTQDANAIVKDLQTLVQEHPHALKVDYYCDAAGTFITPKAIQEACSSGKQANNSQGQKLLIVSGPEGFVNHLAGPKEWKDGVETQGRLSGVVADLRLKDWIVQKL